MKRATLPPVFELNRFVSSLLGNTFLEIQNIITFTEFLKTDNRRFKKPAFQPDPFSSSQDFPHKTLFRPSHPPFLNYFLSNQIDLPSAFNKMSSLKRFSNYNLFLRYANLLTRKGFREKFFNVASTAIFLSHFMQPYAGGVANWSNGFIFKFFNGKIKDLPLSITVEDMDIQTLNTQNK